MQISNGMLGGENEEGIEERARSEVIFLRDATSVFLEQKNLKAEWEEFSRDCWIASTLDQEDESAAENEGPVTSECFVAQNYLKRS
jgi:hypothetical protein